MEELYEKLKDDAVACREEAKRLLFSTNPTVEEENMGIKLLTRAVKLQDPEAMYVMGKQFLERRMKPLQGGYLENAIRLIGKSADLGYGPARVYMEQDYSQKPAQEKKEPSFQVSARCTYDYFTIRSLVHLQMYGKGNPKNRFLLWSVIYGVLLVLLIANRIGGSDNLQPVVLWTIWYGLMVYMHFGWPKVQYNAQAKLKNTVNEYVFLEDRVQIQSTNAGVQTNAVLCYSVLYKIKETDRYLFIWQNKNQVIIVDKFTFNGGMPEVLQEKLRSLLGKKYVRCHY